MPAQGSTPRDTESVVQMPADLFTQLVKALGQIANNQRTETAIELQTLLATETNAAIERWQTAALTTLVDRIGSQGQRTTREPTLPQKQLALRYEALRTALGRVGSAVMFLGVASRDTVTIVQGNVPSEPLVLVVYGPTGKIGSGPLVNDETGLAAQIPGLTDKTVVTRLELWDKTGTPVRFGLLTR